MQFVENRGQWSSPAQFVAVGGTVTASLESNSIRIHKPAQPGAVIRLQFEDAERNPMLVGEDKNLSSYHFYFSDDPDCWRTNVASYSSVLYRGLYPGVDLRVRGLNRILEYDLLLSPSADLDKVQIRTEGVKELRLAPDGSLEMLTASGPLRQARPKTWEVLAGGETRPVQCEFRILGPDLYGFAAPTRDKSLALVIDPGLNWGTYIGGAFSDQLTTVALARDGTGDIYVGGYMNSPDFPFFAEPDFTPEQNRAFIARLNSNGTVLKWAAFLGGWHSQLVHRGLAAAPDGGAALVGQTVSPDFPTTPGAFSRTAKFEDAFVARFNAAGGLVFSTFLGGWGSEEAYAVGFDPSGAVIVGGNTTSSDFPTTAGAFDRTYHTPNAPDRGGAHGDIFVSRFSLDGGSLTYSTFVGGPSLDILEDMTVDPFGYVTFVGWVTGNLDPVFVSTPDAFDRTWNGSQDCIIARLKLDGAGAADLKYATMIGGSNMDNFYGVAFDPANPEIVTAVGMSWSDDFPVTPGVIDPTNPRFSALFESQASIIARFRFPAGGAGSRLWSSYFGPDGGANILATDVTVNNLGEPVVVGLMGDGNMGTTRGAFDRLPEGTLNRGNNFILRLSPDGTQARYSSYFGSTGNDSDQFNMSPALAYVGGNSVIIASSTASALFHVTEGAFDTTFGGVLPGADGYVVRFTTEPDDSGDLEVGTPTILSPPNGAKFGFGSFMGRLRWTDVPDPSGIDGYEFELSTRADFVNSIKGTSHRAEHIHPGSATGESGFSLGSHFWRVRAFDRAGNIGAWSAVSSFTLDAPDPQPTLKTVGTYPSAVVGGAPAVGILYLDRPAGPGGVTVDLSLRYNRAVGFVAPNLPIPVTVPRTVTIPEGAMNVVFDLSTSEVDATVAVDIVATINGIGTSNNIHVRPPSSVDIRELLVYPVTVTGGNPSMGTLTLKDAAPPGGVLVRLTTGHPQAASVPSSVVVPEGERTVTFPITTRAVAFDIDTVVRAHTAFDSEAKYVFVRPPTGVRLESLSVNPGTLNGGMISTGRVALNMPAPITTWPAFDGVHVNLSSSRPDIIGLPPFITIYNPDTAGTFTFFARSVPTTTSITLTAAYDNFVVTAPLVVNAGPAVSISSLTLNVSTVIGTHGGVATAHLSAPAPSGGVTIQFSTSDPDIFFSSEPVAFASQGSSSAAVAFIAKNVSATKTVNIIASYGSSSASAAVTINPSDGLARWPVSVAVNPTSIAGGGSATGTININMPASAGGTRFQLSTTSSSVSVPATVTVPEGATTVTFPINASAVSSTSAVDIWALHNFSLSARLTLTPGGSTPAAPGTPSLLSPANDAVVTQPITLDWSDAANAVSYEIHIDNSSTFSAPLVRSLTSTASQVSVSGLSNVRHWWRVRARNSAGQAGSWSTVRRFTPQGSSTTTPASLSSISLTPTSVTGGSSSTGTARLSSAAPSGGVVVTLSSSSQNAIVPASITVPSGSSSANFTVSTRTVTAASAATISGALNGVTRSATLTINPASSGTLAAPSLVSPGSDARFSPGQNITFDWSDVSGAASYTIQIDDSDSFSSPQIVNQNTTASTYSSATLPTRTMWWRARANNSSGSPGNWSSIRRFEVKD